MIVFSFVLIILSIRVSPLNLPVLSGTNEFLVQNELIEPFVTSLTIDPSNSTVQMLFWNSLKDFQISTCPLSTNFDPSVCQNITFPAWPKIPSFFSFSFLTPVYTPSGYLQFLIGNASYSVVVTCLNLNCSSNHLENIPIPMQNPVTSLIGTKAKLQASGFPIFMTSNNISGSVSFLACLNQFCSSYQINQFPEPSTFSFDFFIDPISNNPVFAIGYSTSSLYVGRCLDSSCNSTTYLSVTEPINVKSLTVFPSFRNASNLMFYSCYDNLQLFDCDNENCSSRTSTLLFSTFLELPALTVRIDPITNMTVWTGVLETTTKIFVCNDPICSDSNNFTFNGEPNQFSSFEETIHTSVWISPDSEIFFLIYPSLIYPFPFCSASFGNISNFCTICAPGTFSSSAGVGPCSSCPPLSVAEIGSQSCTICLPGLLPNAQTSDCVACPSGTFRSKSMSSCSSCSGCAGFSGLSTEIYPSVWNTPQKSSFEIIPSKPYNKLQATLDITIVLLSIAFSQFLFVIFLLRSRSRTQKINNKLPEWFIKLDLFPSMIHEDNENSSMSSVLSYPREKYQGILTISFLLGIVLILTTQIYAFSEANFSLSSEPQAEIDIAKKDIDIDFVSNFGAFSDYSISCNKFKIVNTELTHDSNHDYLSFTVKDFSFGKSVESCSLTQASSSFSFLDIVVSTLPPQYGFRADKPKPAKSSVTHLHIDNQLLKFVSFNLSLVPISTEESLTDFTDSGFLIRQDTHSPILDGSIAANVPFLTQINFLVVSPMHTQIIQTRPSISVLSQTIGLLSGLILMIRFVSNYLRVHNSKAPLFPSSLPKKNDSIPDNALELMPVQDD